MKPFIWISNRTAKPFYARKQFVITKEVLQAKAYVCGLGQFNFYLNGEKVSDHVLDPGWTNYDKQIQYVAFPVTEMLRAGENTAGIEVGNGWYIRDDEHYSFAFPEFMPPNPNPYRAFGPYLTAAVSIEIQYRDGSRELIQADDTWKTAAHPVIMSNVFGSETMDGRMKANGWNRNGFADETWEYAFLLTEAEKPKGVPTEQKQPPIVPKYLYEGRYLHDFGDMEIYDLTQNMSGMLQFEIRGRRGDRIEVYPAEKLGADGNVDQMAKNWRLIDSAETYIIGEDDVWESYSMVFTYFAGRYLAIKGAGREGAGKKAEIRNIKSAFITSASRDNGLFTCDDQRYEQIYDLVLKAVECNLMSVHTDCPQIERFAWQEANHLMAPSIMFMKNVSLLWRKLMTDVRAEQCSAGDWYYDRQGERYYPGDGLVPSQAPCYEPNVLPVPGMGSFFDTIAWGSSCILAPYWHYMYYGDPAIIKENYETGKRYFKYLTQRINENGFINHGLGDWGNPREGSLARENIETAFLYADAKILAEFAGVLGYPAEQAAYRSDAARLADHYNKKLLQKHPEKGYYCYRNFEYQKSFHTTQACQALPLYWGMVPEDKIADVVQAFRDQLEADQAFVSGEIGLPYIIQVMARYDMNDLISSFILKESHPSYYAFVREGETTLGEYWETNPRSHCHDMMGHIAEWYYNGIAGIRIEEAGCKRITVKPFLPESIRHVSVSYQSSRGRIAVSLNEHEEYVAVELEVPEQVQWEFDNSYLKKSGKEITLTLKNYRQ